MNRTLCYNFAKGSDSLLCHVNNFKEFNKTIATYGVLRGTLEVINKVKNYFYMDHGYFNQSKRIFENNQTKVNDMDGYFRIVYNNFIHNGKGNFPNDRLKKLNLAILDQKKIDNLDHGKYLEGNVHREFRLDVEFMQKIKWAEFLAKSCQKWLFEGHNISIKKFRL